MYTLDGPWQLDDQTALRLAVDFAEPRDDTDLAGVDGADAQHQQEHYG
jgi:hypothetical protein